MRLLFVHVKGLIEKRIEFVTIMYSSIHSFSVESAGLFKRYTEMRLHLPHLGEHNCITQEFRTGEANLWAIQKVLCNHILGKDKDPIAGADQYRDSEAFTNLNGVLTNMQQTMDCAVIQTTLKADPPILQGSEQVEIAFQGFRHVTLFTTKRVIFIDKKLWNAGSIKYLSYPWSSFLAFEVHPANFKLFDTKVHLYTELQFYPGEPKDDDNPSGIPARPELSCLCLEFDKNCVDAIRLKYYLSKRIIEVDDLKLGAPVAMPILTEEQRDYGRTFQWLGDPQRGLDPIELEREFHTKSKILLDEEKIFLALRSVSHIFLCTNLRVMAILVSGLSNMRFLYTSLPYRSIRYYSVYLGPASVGMKSSVCIYTRNRWNLASIGFSFLAGTADVLQLQEILSSFIVGCHTDPKVVFRPKTCIGYEKNPFGLNRFLPMAIEINPEQLNVQFHHVYPLLLEEETVLKALEQGTKFFLYTNLRLIIVTGRMDFVSVPYKSIHGFFFETAARFDPKASISLYTTSARCTQTDKPRVCNLLISSVNISPKQTDIYKMAHFILDHTIIHPPTNVGAAPPRVIMATEAVQAQDSDEGIIVASEAVLIRK
ncbi:unnamed protein product [Pseudo-nitzschia multistriata]|uniref:Bacterial Pleckstrin homology domain-containing protein n=1 Tax=Pseudo-nitzschia multistriata TaxID=183589 RepID=A0A448ZQ68_9STRA|nr:unnamed protein product [Pseudo-nitzschia multistriata]